MEKATFGACERHDGRQLLHDGCLDSCGDGVTCGECRCGPQCQQPGPNGLKASPPPAISSLACRQEQTY